MNRRGQTSAPRVAIVILNWNGWQDTLQCLDSVFALDYAAFQVIVCDNGSTDGSLDHLREWAKTRGLEIAEVAAGEKAPLHAEKNRERLVLLDTGANLGFAGGNNAGCRLAMSERGFDYLWLLNNDTVVAPGALAALVDKLESHPEAGVCGSRLIYHHRPDRLQAAGGGTYNRWLARSAHVAAFRAASEDISEDWVESRMDYVIGASMLMRTALLERIGLLTEDYFLYFEEIDFACRTRNVSRLAYAHGSIVWHKEGGSINGPARKRSLLADRLSLLNRLKFTRRFFPYALPTVYLGIGMTLARYAASGDWPRLGYLTRLLLRASFTEVPAVEGTPSVEVPRARPRDARP